MITRDEMEKQLQKIDVESLIIYSHLLHFLQQEPDDEITRGLRDALIRRLENGQSVEPELRSQT